LPKTRNVVFVHGLFADGSCWAKVITRHVETWDVWRSENQ
jgi:hypothetical protein